MRIMHNISKHRRLYGLVILILQIVLISPSFASNRIKAEVDKVLDNIPAAFSYCSTDWLRAPTNEDLEASEKLQNLGRLGDDVIPILVENITSDKNYNKYMGGDAHASFCALDLILKGQINYDKIQIVIDDYYAPHFMAPCAWCFPNDLRRKIQIEIVNQLGNIDCTENKGTVHCRFKNQ